ncbi:hypothetical protein G6O67_002638 [Ophiocordyceps sinensis]|uniref:Uncharacterized protein n=1 Tax=Ophiocordyceps sinensis TaxID=72228 RepID=A0A8H4V7P3_9HYPO|nr:hypothetical protein G6O67_002638 [Ophiocordyceps sinensis]
MPTSSVYPPIWQFDAPPAAALSPWEPPTTPSYRRQKHERLGFSGLVSRWLGHSQADEPIVPPATVHVDAVDGATQRQSTLEATAPVHVHAVDSAAQHQTTLEATESASSSSLQVKLEFVNLRSAICALETDEENRLRPLFESCARSLRHRLQSGELFIDALDADVLEPLDPATRKRIPTENMADELVATFRSILLSGLEAVDSDGDRSDNAALWLGFAQKLRCGRRFPLITSPKWPKQSWWNMRAATTQLNTDLLKTHMSIALPDGPLSCLDLWHLLLARFMAAGAVECEHGQLLLDAEYESLGERWTFLVLALMASRERDESLCELCSFLSSLGQFETMARSLTERALSFVRIDAVQAIALACDDHHRAIALHDALVSMEGWDQTTAAWDWTTWAKYAERIIKDPAIDTWRIWDLLDLTPRSRYRFETAGDAEAKVRLLNQMSQWFMEAPHINDRQLLRELERVIYIQRGLTRKVSHQTLAHLADLLTRDLSRGESGRTERLEWLVQLVAQTQGMETAVHTASAIRGWRWTLARKAFMDKTGRGVGGSPLG